MGLIRPSYPQGSGSSADQQEAYGLIPPLSDTPVTPFPGFGGPASNSAIGDSATTGTATTASHSDHVHGREALSTATPLVESGSGSAGVGTKNSREDHVHPAAAGAVNNSAIAQRTAGDLTTTSTALVDLTGLTVTLTTGAHRCRVFFDAMTKISTEAGTPNVIFDIEIDGVAQGQTYGLKFNGNSLPTPTSIFLLTPVLSAGSHTIKVVWRVDGGTGTCYASTSISPTTLVVEETGLTT